MEDVINIVRVQDRWTPKAPSGLSFQLSVLTWFERDEGSAEPWELVSILMPRLAELAEADELFAGYRLPGLQRYFRKEENRYYYRRKWDDPDCGCNSEAPKKESFPDRFLFNKKGRAVLIAQTAFWNLCGGPAPWHDSVAISFFSVSDIRNRIEEYILDACRTLGIRQINAD